MNTVALLIESYSDSAETTIHVWASVEHAVGHAQELAEQCDAEAGTETDWVWHTVGNDRILEGGNDDPVWTVRVMPVL